MKIKRTYKANGKDAFELILDIDFKKGNSIRSTIPIEFINDNWGKFVDKIKHAYFPYPWNGEPMMNELAMKIKTNREAEEYFYPDYLLCNGIAPNQLPESIHQLNEVFLAFPGTYFSASSFPIDFFVMRGWYFARRNSIKKNSQEISHAEFEDNLTSVEMKIEYYSKYRSLLNNAYTLSEGGESKFMLLTDQDDKLIMVLSL